MSLAKAAIVTLGCSGCLASAVIAQDPTPQPAAALPQVYSSSEIQVPTTGRIAMIRLLQQSDDAAVEASTPPEETLPPRSRYENRPQASSRNESDVAQVEPPTAAMPPIALDDLTIPNLSLEGIGTGDTPDDMAVGRLPAPILLPIGAERRIDLAYVKPWVAPGFCHQPLYFEDAMLERHGHQRFPYLQPMISGAKFFGTIPLAPYKWALQHPLEDRHTLGSFRPGTPAPVLRQRLPYEPEAVRNQLGATAAAAVAIP